MSLCYIGQSDTSLCTPRHDSKYDRNLKDDFKKAVDLLWKFKEELNELHPNCEFLINQLLGVK